MEPLRVMTVFGTRPEAIKMAPLVLALKEREGIDCVCCVTGQHREMLDSALKIFGISPDYDLSIMQPGQSLSSIVSRTLHGLDDVLNEAAPDLVLVHGDTSTTFAGALSSFYHKIMVGHVEAGLRTYDRYSPYPEEMNRTLTGDLSSLHFCPTGQNRKNLAAEGISADVFVTGNTVIDAMKYTVKDNFEFFSPVLRDLKNNGRRTILLTAHRRENYGQPMQNILDAIVDIVTEFEDVDVVYPVHLSPSVQSVVYPALGDIERVHLIDPLDVDELHNLMAQSYLVLTDSGGLQEEAPSLGVPVLVLRRETERPEAVKAGTVKMAGVERQAIYDMTAELLTSSVSYEKMSRSVNPYGDGHACRRIIDAILWKFDRGGRPEEWSGE